MDDLAIAVPMTSETSVEITFTELGGANEAQAALSTSLNATSIASSLASLLNVTEEEVTVTNQPTIFPPHPPPLSPPPLPPLPPPSPPSPLETFPPSSPNPAAPQTAETWSIVLVIGIAACVILLTVASYYVYRQTVRPGGQAAAKDISQAVAQRELKPLVQQRKLLPFMFLEA